MNLTYDEQKVYDKSEIKEHNLYGDLEEEIPPHHFCPFCKDSRRRPTEKMSGTARKQNSFLHGSLVEKAPAMIYLQTL